MCDSLWCYISDGILIKNPEYDMIDKKQMVKFNWGNICMWICRAIMENNLLLRL